MIEIENVRKSFGPLEVLKGIDLTVAKGEVLDTLRMLAREGMTMICVTHEMKFAREVSDRVAFFHQGVMREIAPPAELFGAPKTPELQKFLAATH